MRVFCGLWFTVCGLIGGLVDMICVALYGSILITFSWLLCLRCG